MSKVPVFQSSEEICFVSTVSTFQESQGLQKK